VPVIEVHVKSGDMVKAEDALVTLESDKATMDVPSPSAGTIGDVKVKVGDKVSEGSLLITLSTGASAAAKVGAPAAAAPSPASAPKAVPAAASYSGAADVECEMLVVGAGPGG